MSAQDSHGGPARPPIDTAELERLADECRDMGNEAHQQPGASKYMRTLWKAEALLREVLAHRKAEAWHPIETAPKDGTAILATGVNFGLPGRGRHYALARWERCEHPSPDDWSGWYEPDGDGGPYYWLTHWMPLPEAPQ